jgi:uncharacterized protein (TIGR02246 family)
VDQSKVEAEVMEVAHQLMAAWNAEDLEASVAPFHSKDLHVVWGSSIDDTPDAFRDRMARIWDRWPSWEGEWEYTHVKAIGDDAALFLGRYTATLTDDEGESSTFTPHWTALFELGSGGWKITVADHAF